MDSILELISRDDGKKLDEILRGQKTKKTQNNLDSKTKDFEELLVFASYQDPPFACWFCQSLVSLQISRNTVVELSSVNALLPSDLSFAFQ